MDRFAPPRFADDAHVELVCQNPDCPGRKGDTVRVHFLARIARVDFSEEDGEEETLEECACPYCGHEGARPASPDELADDIIDVPEGKP